MSEKILEINGESFPHEVLEHKGPVIVDFYSDECPPCEALAPIYEKMQEKYGDYIKFVKIFRQENREFAKSIGVTGSPTVLFYNDGQEVGSRLSGFLSMSEVRTTILSSYGSFLPKETLKRVDVDLLILGAGAAGLSAAVYAARAKLNTLILDEGTPGGQTAAIHKVANYPGTPGTISGKELIHNMMEQAKSFGTKIEFLKEIQEINLTSHPKYVLTDDTEYYAHSVIVATGARPSKPKTLDAENADEFKGNGVHYCATCDGAMYETKKVAVIGGNSTAVEEAIFLTRFASKVTIIHNEETFKAPKALLQELSENKKIDFIWNTEVRKISGSHQGLTSLTLENLMSKEQSEFPTEGVFVYVGTEPMSKIFVGQVDTDEQGYIKAGEDTKTNVEGVFVAGDIRTKAIRQIITAASDGAVAGIMAERYLKTIGH